MLEQVRNWLNIQGNSQDECQKSVKQSLLLMEDSWMNKNVIDLLKVVSVFCYIMNASCV